MVGDSGPSGQVANILRAAGYAVVLARSGPDALQMIRHRRFAAIVVDAGASGFGPDDLARVTEDPPPVVVLSPVADDANDVSTGYRDGARLPKPVSPFELVGAVARAAGLAPR